MTTSTQPNNTTAPSRPIFLILRLPTSDEVEGSNASTPTEVHDLLGTGATSAGHDRRDTAFVEQLLGDVLPKGRATITVEQMAKVVGLGRTGAYEAVKRGDIPSRRVNGRLVIPVPALLHWLHGAETPERST